MSAQRYIRWGIGKTAKGMICLLIQNLRVLEAPYRCQSPPCRFSAFLDLSGRITTRLEVCRRLA